MDATSLASRRNKILEFTIQTYVDTAVPVGSHEVCRRFHLRLSPATVRNVMGDLEEERLLTHPHTSAGRIPTHRGYRYYVDVLMTPQVLTEAERRALAAFSGRAADDPLELLREAAHVLSVLTGQTAVVLAPRLRQSILRRIDLIPVDAHRVLGLVMTRDGLLQHAYLELDELVDSDELARVARFLNEELSGQLLSDIHEHLQQSLLGPATAFSHLFKRAEQMWSLGGFLDTELPVFIEGVSHLLVQPEFRQAEHSRPLLEALERHQPVAELLEATMDYGRRRMAIGEHPHPGFARCSVVSAPYHAGDRIAGAVGVLGPTRMEYARIAALVDHAADQISRAMDRFIG